jgi:hypothetical protein
LTLNPVGASASVTAVAMAAGAPIAPSSPAPRPPRTFLVAGVSRWIDRVITASDLHESDYTPWEGWHVSAWPRLTLLRGQVVARDGSFVGNPSGGRRVIRRLSDEIRSGSRYV